MSVKLNLAITFWAFENLTAAIENHEYFFRQDVILVTFINENILMKKILRT